MTGRTRLCWTAAALLLVSGCEALSRNCTGAAEIYRFRRNDKSSGLCRVSYQLREQEKSSPCPAQGLVFVLDGAGGFGVASRIITGTIAAEKLPLEARTFSWTHGYCRVFADEMHASHSRRQGRRLAELILCSRQEAPERPIYLIAHSAGCGVALVAAEVLPPDTLERIVLLAPAVSSKHDLRAALRSSCQGVDVFISSHDWCCLGIATSLMGTADHRWLAGAAGRVGFQPIHACPEDEALYAKLRQYPWEPGLSCTGHKGGHYGSYQPGFLRAFVLPLLH